MAEKTESNSEEIVLDGEETGTHVVLSDELHLADDNARLEKAERKAVKRYRREVQLRPYQAELIKMQQYLEEQGERMIILFEGRDAAGHRPVSSVRTRTLESADIAPTVQLSSQRCSSDCCLPKPSCHDAATADARRLSCKTAMQTGQIPASER